MMAHRWAIRVGAGCFALMLSVSCAIGGQGISKKCNGGCPVAREPWPPLMVSPQARRALANPPGPKLAHLSLGEQRKRLEAYQASFGARQMREYPVSIREDTVDGIPVRVITPKRGPVRRDRIFIDLHGGAFITDSGSLTENIPIAATTHTAVIAVLYRLAPEHPFPAAVQDAVKVYQVELHIYGANHIGLYGTSAGAILTAETAVELKRLHIPLPAALGFFSGTANLGEAGDSEYLYPIRGTMPVVLKPYIAGTKPTNPVLSPAYAQLGGFPPTLCVSSTHDVLLSDTAMFQRRLLAAGVDARLVVFEALPHAFWAYLDTPESAEAFRIMSAFLGGHVK